MDKVAVLIPCYNESKTIEKVVTDFKNSLKDCVVYVYDNNSTDDTAAIAEKAGAVVRHEYQQGKGNVVRRMFQEIEAECYIIVDGDDTYPAEYAAEMVVTAEPLKMAPSSSRVIATVCSFQCIRSEEVAWPHDILPQSLPCGLY